MKSSEKLWGTGSASRVHPATSWSPREPEELRPRERLEEPEEPPPPPDDRVTSTVNFHGGRRCNDTHQSTTDPVTILTELIV